jgi:hypothetical protein
MSDEALELASLASLASLAGLQCGRARTKDALRHVLANS